MNNIVALRPDDPTASLAVLSLEEKRLSGRYTLEHILGIGGMSVVYRATDQMLQTFGADQHLLAVKMVSESMRENLQAEKLLLNEYAIASTLKHPNIVAVRHFDVCRTRQQAFLVMDWIEGLLLEELIYRQTIAPECSLSLAQQLIAAVHYCHQHHIIHGDLKLANIIVTPSNHLTLIDFGISQHGEQPMPGYAEIRACSHRYAAPEIIRQEPVTFASDIFSLSCVLYRLLSGNHPFPDTADAAEKEQLHIPYIYGKRHPVDRVLQCGLRWQKEERQVRISDFLSVFSNLKPENLKRRWF